MRLLSACSVFMSYRPGLPNVLKGFSLEVGPGEKIGGTRSFVTFRSRSGRLISELTSTVVGRTGAGKSTIMNCLFRLQELNQGTIKVDGIDISVRLSVLTTIPLELRC